MIRTAALSLLLLLTGCASAPGIPETRYFRLPAAAEASRLTAPVLADPIVVDTFYADGVHADQALLYSLDPEGDQLRAYHYQLWADPPTRMLQRRLIRALDAAGVAPLVVDRLPPTGRQYRLQARIEGFERLQREDGWHVRAILAIRLDHSDATRPVLLRTYRDERRVEGTSMRDSVRALGAAVDGLFAQLVQDLQTPSLAAGAR